MALTQQALAQHTALLVLIQTLMELCATIVVAHAVLMRKWDVQVVAMGFRLVLLGRLNVCRVQKEHFPP